MTPIQQLIVIMFAVNLVLGLQTALIVRWVRS